MKRYKITFKFWNSLNELIDDCLDNNGKGYELTDAEHIASQLKTNQTITNVEIEEKITNTYEVIKKVMDSTRINEDDKVYTIEMFLKGWYTEQNIEWIWA